MQYAAHLPSRRSLVVPVVSLAIGAAGAVGIYSVLDETDVTVERTPIVVTESPGTTAKDEAATAAAIGNPVESSSTGKDEAATAAAIGSPVESSSPGKDEAATAAAIGSPVESSSPGKDEAATAAAIGGGTEQSSPGDRNENPEPKSFSGSR